MKIFLIIILFAFLCSCGPDWSGKSWYGKPTKLGSGMETVTFVKVCLEGHAYWAGYWTGSLAPIFDDTGKPVKCEE